jgi:hypothetical protein
VCVESKRLQHLKEGVREGSLKDFKVVGKISGRIGPSNLLKDSIEKLCLEGWQEASQVCTQVDKFYGGTLSHFVDCIRKNERLIYSRENSTNHREPLDLAGVQGDTVIYSHSV